MIETTEATYSEVNARSPGRAAPMSLDTCLVHMPYAAVERPSIGLGLLQSSLLNSGLTARVLYANLAFAERIGLPTFDALCRMAPERLLGEWTFSQAAFGQQTADERPSLHGLPDRLGGVPMAEALARVRAETDDFVDHMARAVLQTRPRVVGCTSSFQQHCASLALLRRIRALDPSVVTVIGGANCEGRMGAVLARSFDWVDVVFSGEADLAIVSLVRELVARGRDFDPDSLPEGSITAGRARDGSPPRAIVHDLQKLPVPTYDDYLTALSASTLGHRVRPTLLAESSRGCWWGQRKHCTFCGLNGSGMSYRSKSASRTLAELDALSTRYGHTSFEMVDNILDLAYLDELLLPLAERGGPYALFYETKANLRRHQVERLVDAGVHRIQPGIENLHDQALRAIDKGCTTAHNLQLLKWSRGAGLGVVWSILVGIPGESDDWWAETAQWMPLIEHLEPPSGVSPIHFQRFSPYHARAGEYGLSLRPAPVHRQLFPLSDADLAELAYHFEDTAGAVPEAGEGRQALESAVAGWKDAWARPRKPRLHMGERDGELVIEDTRRCAVAPRHSLRGLDAELYRACDAFRSPAQVARECEGFASVAEVERVADGLRERGLLLRRGGRLFALATSGTRTPVVARPQARAVKEPPVRRSPRLTVLAP